MTVETAPVPAYRPFAARSPRVQRLSPSFLRVTFTGPDLDVFASNGGDQRIKVLLPLPGRRAARLPPGRRLVRRVARAARGAAATRCAPTPCARAAATRRGRRRLRAARRDRSGLGVGRDRRAPATRSCWSARTRCFPGPTGGFEWRPPAGATRLLLAGDETAVPAICAIVEALPAGSGPGCCSRCRRRDDVLNLAAPAGVR